jgi:hypothetical protein
LASSDMYVAIGQVQEYNVETVHVFAFTHLLS